MWIHDDRTCPSALDLLEYVRDSSTASDVSGHLRECPSCTETSKILESERKAFESRDGFRLLVPADVRSVSATRAAHFRNLMELHAPRRLQAGQIWATTPQGDSAEGESVAAAMVPRLVIVIGTEFEITDERHPAVAALPVSLDLAYQADRDLLVPEAVSPLGYPFMVETWNDVAMLRSQLTRYLGLLPERLTQFVLQLHRSQFSTRSGLQSPENRRWPNYESSQAPTSEFNLLELGGSVGPAISHAEDPRVAFQKQEVEACQYLRTPLLTLISMAEQEDVPSIKGSLSPKVVSFRLPLRAVPMARETRPKEAPALAAAGIGLGTKYVVVSATGQPQITAEVRVDSKTDRLFVVIERLQPDLEGRAMTIIARTLKGEEVRSEPSIARVQDVVNVAQGRKVRPNQIAELTLEFAEATDD
jgi:hypothetical protein